MTLKKTAAMAPTFTKAPIKGRRFYTLDVFTKTALTGNPLAVVLDSHGLSDERMQAIEPNIIPHYAHFSSMSNLNEKYLICIKNKLFSLNAHANGEHHPNDQEPPKRPNTQQSPAQFRQPHKMQKIEYSFFLDPQAYKAQSRSK
jgi:hypothetical protein